MADPRKLKDPAVGLAEFTALMSAISPNATLPCNGGAEEWWSDDPRLQRRAAELCRACSLVHACRAYAIAAGEIRGVWGATTPAQRRSMRRRASA
jgi:hypothetical protein